MKILILEDIKADADLSMRILKSSFPDSSIMLATTLKEAHFLLQKDKNYDVALLDMRLPDGNGLELLVEIRELGLNTAVIMFTSSGNEEIAVSALKAGADDFLVKTVDYIEKLPGLIEFALASFQQKLQARTEKVRVLHVEHNPVDIDLTKRHLRQYAPQILLDSVATAEEALVLMDSGKREEGLLHELILIDYRLPGINGLEFIKILRQEMKMDLPIILVSGQGNEEIAIQSLKLGANDYLMKNENYLYRLPSLILSAYHHYQLKKNQRALEESEAQYRLLAENSGDVIFTLDMNMNFTYISPAVRSLRGYEPEEAINQEFRDVLTPESMQVVMKITQELFSDLKNSKDTVTQRVVELEMIRKDKSIVWTEVKASVILNDENAPVGILGVTRDITERRRAGEELRKLSRAVEQSPASIVITDPEGIIEYVNPKFTQLTGYSLDEIKGKTPGLLKSGFTTEPEYKDLWNTLNAGGDWRGEFLNKRKDGSLFWELASISSIKNDQGQITHFLAVKEDISQKKQAEDELIKAKEKAEESDRLKTAFLHNISHEIRTPMNAIIGFSGLINNPALSPDKREQYSGLIAESSKQLLTVISDIISISTVEAGLEKIQEKTFNLNSLCQQCLSQFTQRSQIKGITMELEETLPDSEVFIRSDENKLFQILNNLLDNALKFTMKGHVRFGYQKKNNFIEFYVRDTGIGVPREMYEDIFQRFRQIDLTDIREFGGSGLGLSICKAYIELMGGEIWLESEKDKGSTFFFTLPYYPIDRLSFGSEVETEEEGLVFSDAITILVAEDEENNFLLIEELLIDQNINIIHADNGLKAVEYCRSGKKVDLILMDIKMPVMDGYEATRQIRKINPGLPIIAQTAYYREHDKEKALASGCNDFLSKPYNQQVLIEKIAQQLKRT